MLIKMIMKDINREIEKLKAIKCEVDKLEMMRKCCRYHINFLSKSKYEELLANNQFNKDDLYYIVEPEIGQYLRDYMG